MKSFSLFIFVILFIGGATVFGQTDIETLIKKSEALERQDKFPEALAALTEALKLQPDNADLYLRRSLINYGTGNKNGVIDDVKKAATIAPDDKQVVLKAAGFLTYYEQCTDSLKILNDYLAKNPPAAEVFSARSTTKRCLDDPLGAYDDLSAASDLAPQNTAYRADLAELLSKLGDSEKAFENFAKLIKSLESKLAKLDPKFSSEQLKSDLAWVYQMRSRVFHARGETEAEFADLAKFVECRPDFFAYETRAQIYSDHEMYDEAIADLTKALDVAQIPPNGLLTHRAETYILMEKYAEAARDYEEALKTEGTVNAASLKERLAWIKQKAAAKRN